MAFTQLDINHTPTGLVVFYNRRRDSLSQGAICELNQTRLGWELNRWFDTLSAFSPQVKYTLVSRTARRHVLAGIPVTRVCEQWTHEQSGNNYIVENNVVYSLDNPQPNTQPKPIEVARTGRQRKFNLFED
jgi:hypothetical protein